MSTFEVFRKNHVNIRQRHQSKGVITSPVAPVSCDLIKKLQNWQNVTLSRPSVLTLIPNDQAGSFQNLQTLVEVSSILAAQGVYTNPENQASEKPEAVRQTILTEQTLQQQQPYHQQPQTAPW